ncbi:3'-5' exonuclease [Kribbella antibiotica]|uniref:3'-5' exonuclease n=1 Tax=Kribbella antibiotica TaxID=190195 RepID=UPI00192D9180|nr:3'-5' exonuclease [Kribbella antibiotica]
MIYLPARGHQVVLGTAGTGKTVMAIFRAAHLSNPATPGFGRTLLATYNRTLVTYLNYLSPAQQANLTIETFGRFGRGYLHSRSKMRQRGIADAFQRRALIQQALTEVASGYKPHTFFDRDIGWFEDELAWIDGSGILTKTDYRAVKRRGRQTALHDSLREVVWKVREQYRHARTDKGLEYDWHDLASTVLTELRSDSSERRYRHVVIDEGQDLSPQELRSLAAAADPDGSVTFFGDYAQQIYGQDMSWRSCGLTVRAVEEFKDNYRNSTQIARVAIALSEMPQLRGAITDLVEPVAPTAAGPPPTLVQCADEEREIAVTQVRAKVLGAVGKVAVLARTWDDARRACRGLPYISLNTEMGVWHERPGIYCGAYHSAKGLEFDAVILPFCGGARMPHPETVAAFGPDEAATRESKLLYVGITRARSDLLITYSGELSSLLPTTAGLFATVRA